MRLASALIATAFVAVAAPALAADGTEVFESVCAACHQSGGTGTPGLAPPLVDPALWQRLGDKAPDYVANVMIGGLSGTITAGGQGYYGLAMPSQEYLSDEELLAAANHVLQDLAGSKLVVTPDMIAAARAAPLGHKALIALRKGATP
ncbi:cytochrome c [Pleomorphomonas sp. JP5]|uniref:c-type cytochrome n=1 Tax=Pleomorphomonas sp. JP5 TaxID=2942998 RepID=UPI0020433474|nr:cytochrome c [Pleomorphomonas sp. JP5]MCM5557217.1 cytochrome c [Pleomorphomonas sp. JP5]